LYFANCNLPTLNPKPHKSDKRLRITTTTHLERGMSSIRLDRIDKIFGNHRVVRSLDFEVADGEFVVLVGPSGCGKTTILRMIAGLEMPTHGRIYLEDQDVTSLPPQERDLAMVFQSHTLYPHLTVRDNVGFSLRLRRISRNIIANRVDQTARTLGLTTLLGRKPGQISGGERQRVALGRALVREPRAFLFDEPLSNLDAQLRVQLRDELARLHRDLGMTILYVTHDQEEAMLLGDRVAVLREGALQQTGPPVEIYRRPANLFVAEFIGSPGMNLFGANINREGGGLRLESPWISNEIKCDPSSFDNRREVIVGIRPQDIRLAESEPVDAHVIVEGVSPRGSDLVIRASLPGKDNGDPLTLVFPGDRTLSIQDRVRVFFPREKLHFFDSDSGNRLN
jgi:multiple sugar transport system ATP-binding protein